MKSFLLDFTPSNAKVLCCVTPEHSKGTATGPEDYYPNQ